MKNRQTQHTLTTLLPTNANTKIQFTNRNQTLSFTFRLLLHSKPKTENSLRSHFLPISWRPGEFHPINRILVYNFVQLESSKPNAKTHANDLENLNSDLSCQKMSSTTQLPKHFKTELSSSYSKKGGRPTLARFLLIFTILCQKHANSHHFALLSFQTLTNVLTTARGLWGCTCRRRGKCS